MKPLFQSIQVKKPRYNNFDLSHEKKMSLNMGDLVPVFLQEIIPGDKFRVNTEVLMRMAPMVAPVMHRMNVFIHYFFVPNRLVYEDWEKFITGGKTGEEMPNFPTCRFNEDNYLQTQKGSLADYMGVPVIPNTPSGGNMLDVSALPFRAYQLIYNEYYRDQNLQTDLVDTDALTKLGTVTTAEQAVLTTLRKRCWEKDYFTSALPWAQRGNDVLLPADPRYKVSSDIRGGTLESPTIPSASSPLRVDPVVSGKLESQTDNTLARIENLDGIDVTINELRRAVRLQEWLEKNARAGSRYIEQIFSHFGVKSSDARLQRPEYLGGGKNPIVISEVLNTAGGDLPQGNMAGHGISVGNTNQFHKFFEEHGYVLGIMSVLPRTAYQQGVPKELLKFDKFDYYFPEFAHLGEQPIVRKEVFFDNSDSNSEETWGYQARYAEYKFKQSTVHGDFKDNLSFWHMGRIFSSFPELNEDFVKSDPTSRIFAVTTPTVHHLYCQLYNDVRALRPMPVFGTPSL